MILETCPFNNENLIARIKLEENMGNVAKTYIVEANRTFKNTDKPFCFEFPDNESVEYVQFEAQKSFSKRTINFRKQRPYISYKVDPWRNESIQRNFAASLINPFDEDIVVLGDIDEIIDRRSWPQILDEVYRHGIVTVGLHFTMFYLNLFLPRDVKFGPADFSYRVFIMTGKYFKEMNLSSDKLRKLGEGGKLTNDVYRIPGIHGFHHSWLGDASFVVNKLNSYSHDLRDHSAELHDSDGINHEVIKEIMASKKSVFGHTLELRDDVDLLLSVTENSKRLSEFLI